MCYLKRRKNILITSGGSAEGFIRMSQMWEWGRMLCGAGKDALEARCMQIALCSLLNSARCAAH